MLQSDTTVGRPSSGNYNLAKPSQTSGTLYAFVKDNKAFFPNVDKGGNSLIEHNIVHGNYYIQSTPPLPNFIGSSHQIEVGELVELGDKVMLDTAPQP